MSFRIIALAALATLALACARPEAEPAPAGDELAAAGAPTGPPALIGDTSLSACPPRQALLRVGAIQNSQEFSPHPIETEFNSTHYTRIHSLPLFGADPMETKLEAGYGASESWEFLPGAKGLKVKLWNGLTFNDGSAVTAEDVKFSIEALGSEFSTPQGGGIIQAFGAKATVLDDLSLQIDFKEGAVTFVTEMSPLVFPLYLVSKKHHSNGAITQQAVDAFREKPLAAGPYEVVSREAQKFMILKSARRDPVLGCPTYDRVEIRHVPEMGTRMAQLQTGQLDIAEGHRDLIEEAKAMGAKVLSKPAANIIGLYFFQTHLPHNVLKDVRLRQAAAHAIDHQTLAKTIWKGIGVEPWGCTWPPSTEISTAEPAYLKACGTPYPFDQARARQLLEQAGFGANNKPRIKLVYSGNYPEEPDLAQAMQPMLNAVGFDTTIDHISRAEQTRRRNQEGMADSIMFFGPGGRATALAGAYSVYGPTQFYGPKDDKDMIEALERTSRASTEPEYMKAMAAVGKVVYDKAYGPGFFASGSIFFAGPKVPAWGLEKSKGRAPLNLAALITKRG